MSNPPFVSSGTLINQLNSTALALQLLGLVILGAIGQLTLRREAFFYNVIPSSSKFLPFTRSLQMKVICNFHSESNHPVVRIDGLYSLYIIHLHAYAHEC